MTPALRPAQLPILLRPRQFIPLHNAVGAAAVLRIGGTLIPFLLPCAGRRRERPMSTVLPCTGKWTAPIHTSSEPCSEHTRLCQGKCNAGTRCSWQAATANEEADGLNTNEYVVKSKYTSRQRLDLFAHSGLASSALQNTIYVDMGTMLGVYMLSTSMSRSLP